jgi:hypothetical protein
MSDFRIRPAILAAVLATSVVGAVAMTMGSSAALAQSSSSSNSTTATISAKADEVKDWSLRKWNQAKREWRKDKAKWDACNQQANDQKLTGKASWSFLYNCMKAS